jgi:virginiamycin B lyase
VQITEHHVGPGAYGVAVTADGTVWTSLVEQGELVRLDPDGAPTTIRLDSGTSRPMVLSSGPDNAVWFSRADGALGRVDHAGHVSSWPVLTAGSQPYGVCTGSDDAVWYTLLDADRIGHIAADGRAEEFPLPPGSMPSMICPGPDGALWVTLNQANAICRCSVAGDTSVWVALEAGALAHLTGN